MILNKAHWLYLYGILFLLFFILLFSDVKKEFPKIFQHRIEEKDLLNAIEENKKILLGAMQNQKKSLLQIDNKPVDTPNMLSYLLPFFSSEDIAINILQLMQVKTVEGVSVLPIKVNMIGQFSAFTQLVSMLFKSATPMVINSFSLQMNPKGELTAEIQLLVFAMHIEALKEKNQEDHPVNASTLMHSTSLNKMKWAGFLRKENTISGFLMLPDGTTVEVQTGSLVGLESAQVIQVKENEITLSVARKNMRISA